MSFSDLSRKNVDPSASRLFTVTQEFSPGVVRSFERRTILIPGGTMKAHLLVALVVGWAIGLTFPALAQVPLPSKRYLYESVQFSN
jgi:hypothetical protein